ncbi:MAG: cysteine desulfurase family protein [Pseudomonadota bacterium]
MKAIYMDHNSTTPCDPRVVAKMAPYLGESFGNASSEHFFGKEAAEAVEKARESVATLIGASAQELLFTSGTTESINLAVKGVCKAYREEGNRLVTVATEHKAVLESFNAMQSEGFEVEILPVDRFGLVDPKGVEKALTPPTILLAVMLGNNEIGTLHPIFEIGRIAKEKGVLFLCDAAQAVGKIAVDVERMNADLLTVSGHKMYGPKGVGALYVRRKNPRVRLAPAVFGGGQERGLRSGTLNVPGIVGLGEACAIARSEWQGEGLRLQTLRERLKNGILSRLEGVFLNGHPSSRLPHNLSLSFANVDPEPFLALVREELAISTGATCTATSVEPSHVLKAVGVEADLAQATVRFGLGRFNTEQEVDRVIELVVGAVSKLRSVRLRFPSEASAEQ